MNSLEKLALDASHTPTEFKLLWPDDPSLALDVLDGYASNVTVRGRLCNRSCYFRPKIETRYTKDEDGSISLRLDSFHILWFWLEVDINNQYQVTRLQGRTCCDMQCAPIPYALPEPPYILHEPMSIRGNMDLPFHAHCSNGMCRRYVQVNKDESLLQIRVDCNTHSFFWLEINIQ